MTDAVNAQQPDPKVVQIALEIIQHVGPILSENIGNKFTQSTATGINYMLHEFVIQCLTKHNIQEKSNEQV